MRTVPALKQALYAALTVPPLVYVVNDGPPVTLPPQNVFGVEPVDVPDPKPDPMVCVTVGSRGRVSPAIAFRNAEIRLSISSALSNGDDLCDEIYAAILARIESPDADGVNQLSRAATATTLALWAAQIEETDKRAVAYDQASQRYYVAASLSAVVQ